MALLHVNFYAQTLGMASSMDVILPETNQGIGVGGMPPWDGESLLPVLYLLHGSSDDHTIWQRRTSVERYCAGRRLAVVMPCAHLSAYTNQRYGSRYFDFLTQELPDICAKMFRISRAAKDTFIAGLSMGGYGALKAAFNYPDRYAMVAGLSSGVDRLCLLPESLRDFSSLEQLEPLRDSDPALFEKMTLFFRNFGTPAQFACNQQDNLFLLARRQAERGVKLPPIYLACGTEDPLAWEPNLRFRALLDEVGIPYTWREAPGVHEWRLWDLFIQEVLDLLPIEGNYRAVL